MCVLGEESGSAQMVVVGVAGKMSMRGKLASVETENRD